MTAGRGPTQETTSAAFFEAKYAAVDDPWDFATDPAERARYADLLSMLGDRRYERGFEPGCSIGELSVLLAPRCASLLAIDISSIAVDRARRRCRDLPQVELRVGRLPDDLPTDHRGAFDLVVFSEVGYYFDRPTLRRLIDRLAALLEPGGELVAVHWTGRSDDHLITGEAVHEELGTCRGLVEIAAEARPGYVIGKWGRA